MRYAAGASFSKASVWAMSNDSATRASSAIVLGPWAKSPVKAAARSPTWRQCANSSSHPAAAPCSARAQSL
ncbi:hypothetical protein D3C86_1070460 [compost metagenome]